VDRSGLNAEIFVVRADGVGLRRLTRNRSSDNSPQWSRDGQRIFYARFFSEQASAAGAAGIYVMNADGSGKQRIGP